MDGKWHNAAATDTPDGNSGLGADTLADGGQRFNGSWQAFMAREESLHGGVLPDLDLLLGSWGVDLANHEAWAVIDHDADFAVVPEPGTLALLAAAAIGWLVYSRRRK